MGKGKEHQLEFTSLLEQSFKQRQKSIDKYIQDNLEFYLGSATVIQPNLTDWEQIFDRIAFAILSANCPFEDSVKALGYVTTHKQHVEGSYLARFKCVPAKADYINSLPVGDALLNCALREENESWLDYRLRMRYMFKGLGMAKASFACSLLYPLTADLACIDTWMQKVFLRNDSFKTISDKSYLKAENKVRDIAKRHGVGTFLAQWMIWDHARGSKNNHAIFPGSHKCDCGGLCPD